MDQQNKVTVGRFEINLTFWTSAVLAGLAILQVLTWLEPLLSFELTVALVFLLGQLALYPAHRLRFGGGSPRPFWRTASLTATVAAAIFVLAWLTRFVR